MLTVTLRCVALPNVPSMTSGSASVASVTVMRKGSSSCASMLLVVLTVCPAMVEVAVKVWMPGMLGV